MIVNLLLFVLLFGSVRCYTSSVFDQDLYENVLDPVLCEEQLMFLINDTLKFKFLDATGKIPSGILSGNAYELGDYHECLAINQRVNDSLNIEGKYCAVKVPIAANLALIGEDDALDNRNIEALERYTKVGKWARRFNGLGDTGKRNLLMDPALSLALTIGVCLPKACSVELATNLLLEKIPLLSTNSTIQSLYCRLPNDKPFATADLVATIIFSITALLTCVSTIYDLICQFYCNREPKTIYRCFSLYTNAQRLLTFKSTPDALESVNGIRAISMMWVIIGHTYVLTVVFYVHNIIDVFQWITTLSSIWVTSATVTVDTFFLLSGILCVYSTIGKVTRRSFVRSVPMFYLHRFLRMFPLLAAMVLLQASFFNHVSDGPNWQIMAAFTQNCRQYWWSTLLHIQNYVNNHNFCLGQTWYLSVDMQVYFLSPLVMFWLFRSKGSAWCALTFTLLLALIGSSVYSFLFNFSAAIMHPRRLVEVGDYMTKYYINTLARAPPFCIGMAYGYVLHLWRGRNIRIPKIQVFTLWLVSFAMMSFCIFCIYPVVQNDVTQTFDNFVNAYMRAMWALALGWLILACEHGYGGPINWFLSLQMWKLPARLSYAMYLVHFSIIVAANSSWVKTHYFTVGESFYRFTSDLLITFVSAFVLSLVIDAPFSTLQKIVFTRGRARKPANMTGSRENIIAPEA